MSKRNFILLIIILVIIVIGVLGFLYFEQKPTTPSTETPGTNFISQFNPFSSITTIPQKTTPPADVSGYQPPATQQIKLKLTKVSSMPVAGFGVFQKERLKEVVAPSTTDNTANPPTTSTTSTGSGQAPTTPTKKTSKKVTKAPAPLTEFIPALRYVDRTNGNIYQTFADKIEEKKFSGTIIPKIYEAVFGNSGMSAIMRYLKGDNTTIQSFAGNLPKELLGADTTTLNEVKGTFLPENTKDISVSQDGSSIFYLFISGDNVIGTTLNLSTNKKVQVFDSPFTEWLSWWPNSKMITLTTKPSSGIPGYMYAIDPTTKNFGKVFGDINGLTTLTSPSGKLVLYGNDSLSLNIYHTDTKTTDPLGVKTMPEKCVWNKTSDVIYCAVPKSIGSGQYPDSWYQGEISFNDQIWKIDAKTGNASIIADPATLTGGVETDGIKLALDDGENYLFFVNKKDSFLWELNLK